jgi:hypothetical protein
MKNLLTYISPDKTFNDEHKMLVKIQIDNSLELGWKPEDIMLVTNFDYEYNGVKSIVIGDENYCTYHWPATKIYTIVQLFKSGLINKGMCWYHDFDCFQLVPFIESDPGLESSEMGLTNYSRMPRLCSASMFFTETAGDIFEKLKGEIDKSKQDEETEIMKMINCSPDLQKRVKRLNITYAFHKFNLLSCDKIVDKPIRAVHFHLTPDKYDFYVRGENKLKKPLIPDRLIKIFNQHGFKG